MNLWNDFILHFKDKLDKLIKELSIKQTLLLCDPINQYLFINNKLNNYIIDKKNLRLLPINEYKKYQLNILQLRINALYEYEDNCINNFNKINNYLKWIIYYAIIVS